MTVTVVDSIDDVRFARCAEIRRMVFQVGQNVPEKREVDGLDRTSVHFLATLDGRALGTARYRIKNGWAKAERVAVLPEAQRTGLGRALMSALEFHAREKGLNGVLLSSQEDAVHFYKRLHYQVVGEAYLDANIPHRDMKKWF